MVLVEVGAAGGAVVSDVEAVRLLAVTATPYCI